MKRLLPFFLTVLSLSLLVAACNKNERAFNLNISPVTALYAPDDNIFVKLQPATGASVVFEWETAKAEDGTLVMYELAFDKEDGDMSAPIYKITSDGNGVQNRMTLSHKDLNKIAALAGIESLSAGKLKWTAFAYKGTNVVRGEATRFIEVERPAGFAVIPTDLYLSGDATEAGADLTAALQLSQTAAGVFEIYTSLKPGTYRFTDGKSDAAASYQVEGEFIKEGEGQASPATSEKIYRIQLDFNAASSAIAEVTEVAYWFSPNGSIDATLQYQGGGKWTAENVPITFRTESWGKDERYKFRLKVKGADNEERIEWWGSVNSDNSRPDGTPSADYFNLRRIPDNQNDQWNYSFKFRTETDGKNTDIHVNFVPGQAYNHEIVIK